MKTLKLLILIMLTVIAVQAQPNEKFAGAIEKGLAMLDSAKTPEDYIQAANFFERVAAVEQKQWVAQYYAAYTNLLGAMMSKASNEIKDGLYDKALSYADKADALVPDNSEVYVLKGYTTFMKMSVEPQARAMSMIPKANEYLGKAISLNPENPRAYLIQGQNTFYTPEMFGGGKAKAKPILTTAAQKYAKQAVNSIEPQWGANRCQVLLKQCE